MITEKQIKMYFELMKLGMSCDSLKLFPGVLKCFWRTEGACFLVETSRGKYALRMIREEESWLRGEMELLDLLKERQIKGFLYPVRLKDNSFYGILKDGGCFYLTDWPELKPISYRDQIKSLLSLIIEFGSALSSYDFSKLQLKTRQKSLVSIYQDMIGSMKSFATLAVYRLNPTRFDQLFLKYWEDLVAEGDEALNLIESSNYLKMIAARDSLRPIINNFSRRNLRASQNNQAICLNIKDSLLDIPLLDLALLMLKTGRANRWNREWYDWIINTYNQSFILTNDDLEVVRAYLTFPWEAYRLGARYYHNRVNWPVSTFVEKMERILIGDEARRSLLKV